MGSVCPDSDEAPPTIAFNLLNHTHTEDFLSLHDHLGNYAALQGIQYVIGETGAVSVSLEPKGTSIPLHSRFLSSRG
jgi:hypothetical protein